MVYQMDRRLSGPRVRARGLLGARGPGAAGSGARATGAAAGMGVRVKPASFAYHRAGSVPEAVALLAGLGDEAKILAGGLRLGPMMNFRPAPPAPPGDLTRLPGPSHPRAHRDPPHL